MNILAYLDQSIGQEKDLGKAFDEHFGRIGRFSIEEKTGRTPVDFIRNMLEMAEEKGTFTPAGLEIEILNKDVQSAYGFDAHGELVEASAKIDGTHMMNPQMEKLLILLMLMKYGRMLLLI